MLNNGDLPTEDFHLISSCPCWAYTNALTLAALAGDKNTWAPGASLDIVAHVFLPVMRVLYAIGQNNFLTSR